VPEELLIQRSYRCDRCGRALALPPPREFTRLAEFVPESRKSVPHPEDHAWHPRVAYMYVIPAGFITEAASTCHTCRVALLEEALEIERQEAAKEQENVTGK